MTSSLKRRIGLGIIVALALWSGLWLREWIYPASEAYRFRWDMNNAWKQGMIILDAARARPDISKTSPTLGQVYRSYLTRYDAAIAASVDGRYQLDYPPGRLLLIAVWVWASSIAEQVPPESIDTVIWPLLMLNTAFELLLNVIGSSPHPRLTCIPDFHFGCQFWLAEPLIPSGALPFHRSLALRFGRRGPQSWVPPSTQLPC